MDPVRKDKIQRFLSDKTMSGIIYDELREFFLENHGEKDIYMLGARAMSLDLLPLAWSRLQRLAAIEKEPKAPFQPGL